MVPLKGGEMSHLIPILFGTETGNAEYCADMLVSAMVEAGFDAEGIDMQEFDPPELSSHKLVIIITSTYGNGDPPSNAEELLTYLQTTQGLRLHGLRFAVCGLGDETYEHFAQCGKDFDAALLARGATAITKRVDCDVEFEPEFEAFMSSVMNHLGDKAEDYF
jgi:sulfite reductase (NADPH) flavoprotein alpha-component